MCWIGPAAQLLHQAIKEYEIKPCYITNMVKCMPPGDREPKSAEIKACIPYLIQEIEIYKPEFVVPVGGVALKALTGKTGITKFAGRELNGGLTIECKHKCRVFPVIHPSFVLRYPQNLPTFEQNFRTLRDLVAGKKYEWPEVVEFKTWQKVEKRLDSTSQYVDFDYETASDGDDGPKLGDKVRCVGFCDEKGPFVYRYEEDADRKGRRVFMKKWLKSERPKSAYNCAFEVRTSMDRFGVRPLKLVLDSMLMGQLCNENVKHALDLDAMRDLGVPNWDIKPWMDENDFSFKTVPMDRLAPYCGLDCYNTRNLTKKLTTHQDWSEVSGVYKKVLLPLSKMCAKLELRGVHLDRNWTAKLRKLLTGEMENLEKEIRVYPETSKLIKFLDEKKRKLNLNSQQQMSRLLFKYCGVEIRQKTESGAASIKDAALEQVRDQHGLVSPYLGWKQRQTVVNNFIDKFPRFCDENDLIHAHYNAGLVVTGRLSVTKPPMQAIPEDSLVRGMFNSRFKGGTIGSFDFSQLEIRLMANEAKETSLIKAFTEDKDADVHSITATLMFGHNFTKRQRSIAKRINFGIAYGVSEYTLSREFNMSIEEAVEMMRKFKKAYPSIFVWMEKQHAQIKNHGWIKSRFGRKRRLPEAMSGDQWAAEHAMRQAGNFPIQSTGADLTNWSVVRFEERMRKEKMKSIIFLTVHDSIHTDNYPGEEEAVKQLGVDVMENETRDEFKDWLHVPLKADAEISERWGGALKVERRG